MSHWSLAHGVRLPLRSPVVMGILNLTPDSFSDGGEISSVSAAVDRAAQMVEAGAGMLDVGGESTRPGAREVPEDEERCRVVPVVDALARRFPVPVSVDTRKAGVARDALAVGAAAVNDVSGLAFDSHMASVVAEARAGVVIMHMRGTPEDMMARAAYDDVVGEVRDELSQRVSRAEAAGITRDAIVVDPGLGFAKTPQQTLRLLAGLDGLAGLELPILVGPSRKRFIGEILGLPARERVAGTVAACVIAFQAGARIFRVHDVAPVAQALAVASAVAEAGRAGVPEVAA